MTALSADRDTAHRIGEFYDYPWAASEVFYKGQIVFLDSSGNAEAATSASGKIIAGISQEGKTATAVAAAGTVKVRTGVSYLVNSAVNTITKAHIGDTAYAEDDQTVGTSGTTKSPVGMIVDLDSNGVWVLVGALPTAGLLAANNLSDVGTVATARANLSLDTGDDPTFNDLTVAGDQTVAGTLDVAGVTTPAGGVAAAGGFAAYATACHSGGAPAAAAGDGTNATPVVTEIYISEIFVPCNMSVTGIAVLNGSVASDDWHRALLDKDGDIVAASHTGAVTSSGTDAYQKVPFTGGAITVVGPATYYVAQICDGVTDRYNAHPLGAFVTGKITGQTYGSIPATNSLPAGFTADLGPIASLY